MITIGNVLEDTDVLLLMLLLLLLLLMLMMLLPFLMLQIFDPHPNLPVSLSCDLLIYYLHISPKTTIVLVVDEVVLTDNGPSQNLRLAATCLAPVFEDP